LLPAPNTFEPSPNTISKILKIPFIQEMKNPKLKILHSRKVDPEEIIVFWI